MRYEVAHFVCFELKNRATGTWYIGLALLGYLIAQRKPKDSVLTAHSQAEGREVIMFREVKKKETLRKRQLLRLGHA